LTTNSRQRVLAAIGHCALDRLPVNYLGSAQVNQRLRSHFHLAGPRDQRPGDVVEDDWDLLECLGADVRTLRLHYCGPEIPVYTDGRVQSFWGYVRQPTGGEGSTYMASCTLPWADFRTVQDVERYPWPDPAGFDYAGLAAQCQAVEDYAIVYGSPGNLDMLNGTAFARGFEQVLMDIATGDAAGLACMQKRFEFCHEQSRRALEACGGRVDILWIGDDFATQRGLVLSPGKWRCLFLPRFRAFADLAHRYGARLMLHSCGSTRAVWADLVDAGIDIYDTVQPEAAGMQASELAAMFPSICLHGTISTQSTLPFGSTEDVAREVRQRIACFSSRGGLILAPSHNIQNDTKLDNILTLYRMAGSLQT
jgi:uroporphyrinogen decarboxylase